jgi:tRNA modification GTPase
VENNNSTREQGQIVHQQGTTIVAIATAAGNAGIGIVRISGENTQAILCKITGKSGFVAKQATYTCFYDQEGAVIDDGYALYFCAPNSYTGEDVAEIQVHGNSVILDYIVESLLLLGASMAEPGEFTKRAFLNNKIDLAQAESIADLIACTSRRSVQLARRTLNGRFSDFVYELAESIKQVRIILESSLDFSDEDIDIVSESSIQLILDKLLVDFNALHSATRVGSSIREGIRLVIAGNPNTGKSSLINQLVGKELAIVTDQPGTTRDVIREHIDLDGIPCIILDTAGLRSTEDKIEVIGIEKSIEEMNNADLILWLMDDSQVDNSNAMPLESKPDIPIINVVNKIDLTSRMPGTWIKQGMDYVSISAKTGSGLDNLIGSIRSKFLDTVNEEYEFIAKRRHVDALNRCKVHLDHAIDNLKTNNEIEVVAEELRLAQHHLGEITGEFTSDQLLGEIFSKFCIGK